MSHKNFHDSQSRLSAHPLTLISQESWAPTGRSSHSPTKANSPRHQDCSTPRSLSAFCFLKDRLKYDVVCGVRQKCYNTKPQKHQDNFEHALASIEEVIGGKKSSRQKGSELMTHTTSVYWGAQGGNAIFQTSTTIFWSARLSFGQFA